MIITITTPQHQGQEANGETQQPQSQASQTQHYLFTLKFLPGGQIAVLEVRGAINVQEARALACEVLPQCRYEVLDGDQTNGNAQYFYSWTDSTAQERYPRRRPWNTEEARHGNL